VPEAVTVPESTAPAACARSGAAPHAHSVKIPVAKIAIRVLPFV
jgi:hypothetical protein